jgi:hypothetical protein
MVIWRPGLSSFADPRWRLFTSETIQNWPPKISPCIKSFLDRTDHPSNGPLSPYQRCSTISTQILRPWPNPDSKNAKKPHLSLNSSTNSARTMPRYWWMIDSINTYIAIFFLPWSIKNWSDGNQNKQTKKLENQRLHPSSTSRHAPTKLKKLSDIELTKTFLPVNFFLTMVQNSFFGCGLCTLDDPEFAFRMRDPGTKSKSRYLNRMTACPSAEAHAELHEHAPNPMSTGESHRHRRTPRAYGRVNGVTFCVIAHSSASATSSAFWILPLPESSWIHVFSVVLNLRHLPRTMVFDSVRISMGEHRECGRTAWEWENLHVHIAESTESLSALSLTLRRRVCRLLFESFHFMNHL